MTAALIVSWDGARAGALHSDSRGRLGFTYDESWLANASVPALSVSLPKRARAFDDDECRPFFAGLLPEEKPLEAVARALGTSKGNPFALLAALGGDVAGAITLVADDAQAPGLSAAAATDGLTEDALADILSTLPKRPLLAGQDGLRLSLAGAQAKLPVVLVDGRVALPAPGQPTTHIVKPAMAQFRGTVENELLVMRLAAALALDVAPVDARVASGRPYLLITRYDREQDEAETTRRLHQEDLCQALGVPPARKYQSDGGPSFKDSFELIRRVSARPAADVLKLLDAAIFNAVAGNCDAHGKNFSILYRGTTLRLAPLYDLLCTVAYPELSPYFAMKIAKRRTLEEIGVTAWKEFAAEIGMTAPFVRARVRDIAERVRDSVGSLAGELTAPGLEAAAFGDFAKVIADRADRALKMLAD